MAKVLNHMASRGPDGAGAWFSDDGRIALGHRRLSIIDLSDRAAQPMETQDKKLVISYNGEIYNYRSLRKGLEAAGHSFRTHSDTEVLLHLYREKKEAMFDGLRGMYAFTLWDENKRALLLARDPYGIKPLYYADDGWTIRVASQVKTLIASGKVSRQIEPAGIVGFFLFGSVPEPFTTFQEIRAVPAGSFIWIGDLGPSPARSHFSVAATFRHASETPPQVDSKKQQEIVRAALLDSVRHHLVADVPVGAFLSAGVDSGSLVALMKDAGQDSIQTVTLAFEEFLGQPEDEAPIAKRVACHYGTIHTTRLVTKNEFQNDLPAILRAMDQPSIDGMNTWFVSKAARELGLKVVISGLGGDELLGGYPSFKDIPRSVRLFSIPSNIPLAGDVFQILFSKFLARGSSFSPKLAGLLKYGGTYPGAYLLRRGLFMPWELPAIMDEETVAEGLRRLRPLHHIQTAMEPDPKIPYARVATLESNLYLRNQLLRDADWAGMAHSVEIRTPLVDAKILHSLSRVLVTKNGAHPKSLVAHSPRKPLLSEVVLRPKTGFLIPFAAWLQAPGNYLNNWQRISLLGRPGCHWSRRLAYALFGQSVD
jgi:asparagine synthase (glutamine-hydrolysing)